MRTMRAWVLFVAVLILATPHVAQAAVSYVDVNWSGTESGTSGEPYNSLTEAVAAIAVAGGTIYVADGTYASSSNGGFENFGTTGLDFPADMVVKGGYAGWISGGTFDWTEGARTARTSVVDLEGANSRAFNFYNGNNMFTVDGMTFINANNALDGGVIYVKGDFQSGSTVRDCLFSNNVSSAQGGALYLNRSYRNTQILNCTFLTNSAARGGAVYTGAGSSGSTLITNCVFRDNVASQYGGALYPVSGTINDCTFERNRSATYGGAVVLDNSSFTFRRCVFADNVSGNHGSALGVRHSFHMAALALENCLVSGGSGGWAVHHDSRVDSPLTMRHCTVVDNTGGGVWETENLSIHNCIVSGNGATGIKTGDAGPVADYNAVQGHTTDYDGLSAGGHDVSDDPLFIGGGNYKLQWASPCVNTATNLGVAADIEGVLRPQHAGYDMGCYEAIPPATIVTLPATNVLAGSAALNGRLSDTNAAPTSVFIHWGTSNPGTTGAWQHVETLGSQAAGPVTTTVGLSGDTAYYYRCQASNTLGKVWAETGEALMTSEVWIETTAHASEAGLVHGTFTLHRASSAANAVIPIYFARSGSAVADQNYADFGTNVSFAAGQSTAAIDVTPINDTGTQTDTTVTVTLASGPYIVGAPSAASMAIANVPPQTISLAASDGSAAEATRDPGTFTISRAGSIGDPVTVNFAISGSATNEDYVAEPLLTGALLMAAGQTTTNIVITPVLDWYDEGSGEDLVLTLLPGAYDIGASSSGTVAIADYNYGAFSTLYVDVNGPDDLGLGTTNSPLRDLTTAARALAEVGGNRTIAIADGLYRSTAAGGLEDFGTQGIFIKDNASVRGGYAGWTGGSGFDWSAGNRQPRTTIIDLTNTTARAFYMTDGNSSWTYEGLTVINANNGHDGAAIYNSGAFQNGITVRDCLFSNNVTTASGGGVYLKGSYRNVGIYDSVFVSNRAARGGAAVLAPGTSSSGPVTDTVFLSNISSGAGGALGLSGSTTITGCTFSNNTAATFSGAVDYTSGGHTIRRCIFAGNTGGMASGGGAVGTSGNHSMYGLTLENCLLHGNTGNHTVYHVSRLANVLALRHCTVAGNVGGGVYTRDNLSGTNNIVVANGSTGVSTAGTALGWDYNDVYGQTADYDGLSAGAHDISKNPLFLNAPGGDYHLDPFSPCIGAGTDLGVTDDLDGTVREGFDMGCYEGTPPAMGTVVILR